MIFGDTIFLSLMTKMSFKTRFTIGANNSSSSHGVMAMRAL